MLLAITGVTQVMALETALGVTAGHRETTEFVEAWLDEVEHDLARGIPFSLRAPASTCGVSSQEGEQIRC